MMDLSFLIIAGGNAEVPDQLCAFTARLPHVQSLQGGH